jgi:hypothetical protein
MRGILSVGLFVFLATPAWAQDNQTTQTSPQLPPHAAVVPVKLAVKPPTIVNSHILYLNSCKPNGCAIVRDTNGDDSRTNHSSIAPMSGTLKAFSGLPAQFTAIQTCIASALAPFNITVVTTDPGPTVEHFEMIIAGSPTEIGFNSQFEGVAPYLCDAPGQCQGDYIPNAITFAFANAYPQTTLMCGVALQETAHGWTLDHATAASDPMTYNTYTTPLSYRNGAPCGSDCLYGNNNNQNAFGVQCVGTGTNGTHVCMESGAATQDEVTTIMNLFGPAGSATPTVAITSPVTGSAEPIGKVFTINATCTTPDAVAEMDLIVDGAEVGTSLTSPATFNSPVTLALGNHTLEVLCGTTKHASASTSITVMIGNTCTVDADCGGNGQICFQSACIAGQNATGGLGAACTGNSDCKSGQCGDDGTNKLCVIPCDLDAAACPTGFTCLDDGNGSTGVCWLGGGGSSGCATGPGGDKPTAPLIFGLGIVAVWITRRKRPAA